MPWPYVFWCHDQAEFLHGAQRAEGPSRMEFLLSRKAGNKHLGKELQAMSQLIQQGLSAETWPALPIKELVLG